MTVFLGIWREKYINKFKKILKTTPKNF